MPDLSSSNRRRLAIGLTLMVLAALATRVPFFGHPAVDFDEQLYSMIGAQMRHGLLPYTDLWDRKPLGLFLIFAFAHGIGGEGPLAYQVLALAACLLGAWQVWRLGCRIADPAAAALGAALYPVLLALLGSQSGQSEVFLNPLLLAMAQMLLAARDAALPQARRWCLAAMLCGGLALQVKYTVLVQCLFFGICALLMLRAKGRTLAGLAADAALSGMLGLLPTALAAVWYASLGHLDDFLFANFLSIGLRGRMPLGVYWFQSLPFAIPLLALAAGGIFAARHFPSPPAAAERKLPLAWLAVTVFGLLTMSTSYSHNYAAAVPAAILVALPMFDGSRRWSFAVWLVFFLGIWGGSIATTQPHHAHADREIVSQMARALTPHVGARSHCLFVFDGPTVLYRLTGSGFPGRIVYPDHFNNALETPALPVDQAGEVSRILANRPGVIVTARDPVTVQNPVTGALVARELARQYRKLGQWELQDRRLDAFVRLPDDDGRVPECTSGARRGV